MRACANSQTAKITALVTGHPAEKGTKYAAMYGIPKSSIYTYEEYERLADNKAVDAVYIGLPNSMHREYTVRAARIGKHVLCEKPMAISSAECRTMIQACHTANVKLMIAYRVQYDPTWQQAMQIIDSGGIGRPPVVPGRLLQPAAAQAPGGSAENSAAAVRSSISASIRSTRSVIITREEPASYHRHGRRHATTAAASQRWSSR